MPFQRRVMCMSFCLVGADAQGDAYARVPIEDFGKAVLRGMGWDGKETVDSSVYVRFRCSCECRKSSHDRTDWDSAPSPS